jgi:hypothetical protein
LFAVTWMGAVTASYSLTEDHSSFCQKEKRWMMLRWVALNLWPILTRGSIRVPRIHVKTIRISCGNG